MTTTPSNLIQPSAPNQLAASLLGNSSRSKKGLSLRLKTTLLLVTIGTLPVFFVGIITYFIAAHTLEVQLKHTKQADTAAMLDKVGRFLFERYGDIQVLSNLSILRDAKVKQVTSLAARSEALTKYANTYGVYDNIAFMDLNGNDIVVSHNTQLSNHKTEDYFQATLATGKRFISQPRLSQSGGESVIYFAAPVRDSVTARVIGVVRTRMPIRFLDEVIKNYGENDQTYHLADKSGKVFVTNDTPGLGKDATEHLPSFSQLRQARQTAITEDYEPIEKRQIVGGYALLEPILGLPNLDWDGFILSDQKVAFAARDQLAQILIGGTIVAALAVATIAAIVADRLVKPVEEATKTVQKLGEGQLDARLTVKGTDELSTLGANINYMAVQIQNLLESLEGAAEIERLKSLIEHESQVLQTDVVHLLEAVVAVENGDLTVQAPVSDRVTGLVSDTLNRLIEELARIIFEVQSQAQQAAQNATDLDKLAIATVQQARQQAQSVSQVKSLMANVTDLSQEAAAQALVADVAVQLAQEAATQGQQEMTAMTVGITTLQQGTDQITMRVQTLADFVKLAGQFAQSQKRVATMTKVLALNASTTAARAAGQEDPEQFASIAREFEVIANQVNDLATQTNQSLILLQQRTDQIQTVTSGLNKDVQEINQMMFNFTTGVDQSRQAFDNITTATQQVAQVGQQVSQSSSAIAEAAQNTLCSIEDIIAAADATKQQARLTRKQSRAVGKAADTLLELVRFFRLSAHNNL